MKTITHSFDKFIPKINPNFQGKENNPTYFQLKKIWFKLPMKRNDILLKIKTFFVGLHGDFEFGFHMALEFYNFIEGFSNEDGTPKELSDENIYISHYQSKVLDDFRLIDYLMDYDFKGGATGNVVILSLEDANHWLERLTPTEKAYVQMLIDANRLYPAQ